MKSYTFSTLFGGLFLILSIFSVSTKAQVTLSANGMGKTYELINSVFAPGNMAVESPDQCESHPAFGRHIAEVMDKDLNKYVFEFYVHLSPDNDRCTNFDRQRVEIKSYEPSPDNLKGTDGETVTYTWKFKIPTGFQPSSAFTHIHQIKGVGGDDGNPIFTLTPRKVKNGPNQLEVVYVEAETSNPIKLASADLAKFENTWVEVTETIKYGELGAYTIVIKKVIDDFTLIAFEKSNIRTIRPTNTFCRPKWGIYRSLKVPADLRDESIRFTDFSIKEGE